jgi:hypothetical protein
MDNVLPLYRCRVKQEAPANEYSNDGESICQLISKETKQKYLSYNVKLVLVLRERRVESTRNVRIQKKRYQ